MAKIILQGGGEHARVVLDSLLSHGIEVAALFDPKYKGELFGVPQLGAYDSNFEPEAKALVAIGDNTVRKEVCRNTKHKFVNLIDQTAIVSKRAVFGLGCMVLQGTIVQAHCVIGDHVILNTGSRVDHDCIIESFVHVAPGATLCGTVKVGEGSLIGAGAVVLPGISIGRWSTVGAGSVVTHDIPDHSIAWGNPARIHQTVNR
ncbi:MAG: acetyltransferase [Cyclobacteriaceae bacterium]